MGEITRRKTLIIVRAWIGLMLISVTAEAILLNPPIHYDPSSSPAFLDDHRSSNLSFFTPKGLPYYKFIKVLEYLDACIELCFKTHCAHRKAFTHKDCRMTCFWHCYAEYMIN